MRAAWYEKNGPANEVIEVGELPTPEPAAGELRVRLHYSGVNPSDVKTRAGLRGKMSLPRIVPHSDGAGVVDAVGAGADRARLGERAWIWNGAWQRGLGSCAEYICLPAAQVVPLPPGVDFAVGACLGIPAMTAAHALFADGPIAGQTVLVTGGAGSVGHSAVQLAHWAGATVIATVSGDAKAAVARAAGADHLINYRTEDVAARVLELTAGRGVDRIVEVEFGGNLPVSAKVLRAGGVIAAYGSVAIPLPTLPFYELMFRHALIRTLFVYALDVAQRRTALEAITAALRAGKLSPLIGARFPLARTADAHAAVESGKTQGQVLVALEDQNLSQFPT